MYNFLQGGGEMGMLTRELDWTKTSIGAPGKWPQSLQTTISIILNSKFPMFLFWGPDHICFYNDSYRPSLGNQGKHPAALGMPGEKVWPEIWQYIKPLIDQVLQKGEATWSEDQLLPIYRNGKLEDVYWTFSYSPVMEESGKIAGVFVTCTETTEKVLGINKLKISDHRFKNLISQATVGIVVLLGEEMQIEIVNEMYSSLLNKTTEELIGKNLFDIIPEAADPYRVLLDKVRTTGESIYLYDQLYTLFPNGEKKSGYLNIVYQPYRENDGSITGVIAMCQDVTIQNIANKQLQSSEERLRIALDAAGLATFELDYDNPDRIIATGKFDEIFGLDDHATREDMKAAIHPDDEPSRLLAHEESFKTGKLFYESRIIKKNDETGWIKVNGKVIFDESGKPVKLLGILQDITPQKDLQQQKDNFIAMASHELKTPVTSIKAYAQILEQMLTEKGDLKEAGMITRMDTQINRLTNLISDLLNITKINTGRLEYHKTKFDFNRLVEDMTEELQRTSDKHTLILALDKSVDVFADKERLSQVITNFISNAIKYSPKSKVINVFTKKSDDNVTLCVQDFGIGINKQAQAKVFEQFYRVNNDEHQTFQGMGLGLYISAEIIKRENGNIWVNSIEGKGSEFCFSIPVCKEE